MKQHQELLHKSEKKIAFITGIIIGTIIGVIALIGSYSFFNF